MLQAHDEKTDKKSNDPKLFKNIFKVLYATAEDELIVDNDGKVKLLLIFKVASLIFS